MDNIFFVFAQDFFFPPPSQSPSAAWMGGFGAQPPQGQAPPPVIPPPNQAGYGMASYQTQWAGTLNKIVIHDSFSFLWHSEDMKVDIGKWKYLF